MCACAFCGGAAPHLRGFFGLCLTAKHKPFCQTNRSCAGERGGPGPNCRAGHSLTAAFILLLFLLHTQGFLGFLKYFSRSVLPLPPSIPPHSFSLSVTGLWLAVMTEPSPGCQPLLKLSLITPFHQHDTFMHRCMQTRTHTRGKVTNTHADTQTDVPSCTSRRPGSNEKSLGDWTLRQPLYLTKQTPRCSSAKLWKHHVDLRGAGRRWVWWARIDHAPCCAGLWIAN